MTQTGDHLLVLIQHLVGEVLKEDR